MTERRTGSRQPARRRPTRRADPRGSTGLQARDRPASSRSATDGASPRRYHRRVPPGSARAAPGEPARARIDRIRHGERRSRVPEVPMANQFVVELKNEPGSLAILAEALAARGVDLRAIGGGGIGGSGHIIMTTADDDAARSVLEDGGYTFIEGESVLTEVDDRPGGMARLSRELADAGVNIYGHLFLGRWGDRAMFAFVVDDPDKARPILERKG